MININTIRENYTAMTDRQLIDIAQKDGQKLTPDAFQVLQEEFARRQLDESPVQAVLQLKNLRYQEYISDVQQGNDEEFQDAVWTYAIDAKEDNLTNAEILQGLMDHGLDINGAEFILAGIPEKVQAMLNDHAAKVTINVLIVFLGILVTLSSFSFALNSGSGTYIVAFGAMIFGTFRLVKAISDKGRYKRLLIKINTPQIINSDGEALT